MTNVEKLAVLNACFGINFCEQPESRGGKYADVFLKHDRMSDMCTICNWFELNPFNDSEFIQRV